MEPIPGTYRGKGRLVTFHLGQELYGVEIRQIKEVIHWQEVRESQKGPDFIRGVIKSRNQRIPVIDLKGRLGVSGGAEGKQIIMVLDTVPPFGIAIDGISRILNLEPRHYECLPEEAIGNREENCVARAARTEEELILIISPEQILTRREKDIIKNFGETEENG